MSLSNIDNSEFPTLTQIIDRFDLIFVFRENRDPEDLTMERKGGRLLKSMKEKCMKETRNFSGKDTLRMRELFVPR